MSGQPCKTPSDAQKYRDAYMADLNLQIKNNDKNLQANKLHQRTGVVATQISDYRTTSEKLADVETLRAVVRGELSKICDSINCQAIVQKLSVDELRFVAQNIDMIVKDLQPKNKFGVLEPVFRSYLATQMNSAIKAEAKVAGYMLENRGVSSLASLKQLETQVITAENIAEGLRKLKEGPIQERHENLMLELNKISIYVIDKLVLLTPQFYKRLEAIPDYKERIDAMENVARAIRELPSKEQFKEQIESIMRASIRGDEKAERIAELVEMLEVPSLQFLEKIENEVPHTMVGNLVDPRELLKEKLTQKAVLKIIEPYTSLTSYEEVVGMKKTAFNKLTKTEMIDLVRSKMDVLIEMYDEEKASIREEGEKGGDALGYEFGPADVFSRSTAPKSRDAGDLGHMGGEEPASGRMRKQILQRRTQRNEEEAEHLARLNELQTERKARTVTQAVRELAMKKRTDKEEKERVRQEKEHKATELLKKVVSKKQANIQALEESRVPARQRGAEVRQQLLERQAGIIRGTEGGKRPERISRGKGLPFGKYFLHPDKLKDDIVSVQTSAGRNHPQMPTKRVSKGLGAMLRHIASGGNPSYSDLHKMTEEDRSHLSDLVRRCKVDVDVPEGNDKEDLDQFEILQGELGAGNDSPELVKKLKIVILKLMNKGRLPKGQAREILADLVALGY
jgi:hypothetical protein